MLKILIVGGTWSQNISEIKASKLVVKLYYLLKNKFNDDECEITYYNGGYYEDLKSYLDPSKAYDIVFWWPNVLDNSLEKVRNIKEIWPYTMLIASKRNDNNKYDFNYLIQHALTLKANLVFEFSKLDNLYNIRVLDPLGCLFYDGTDFDVAIINALDRLTYLRNITRQKTIQDTTDKSLILKWYFDQFTQPMNQSDKIINIPDEQKFIEIVKQFAYDFHKFMPKTVNTTRFVGNASFRKNPPQVGRCSKGFPSFRKDGYIFVSKRNVDKEFIELDNFVPVYLNETDNQLYYCGKDKPSVDTPVQVRLYKILPNINYMIHSHCYIKGAPFTNKAIPCGAIEEVEEVINILKNHYKFTDLDYYVINLKGHGSIVMSNNLEQFKHTRYQKRELPEFI